MYNTYEDYENELERQKKLEDKEAYLEEQADLNWYDRRHYETD